MNDPRTTSARCSMSAPQTSTARAGATATTKRHDSGSCRRMSRPTTGTDRYCSTVQNAQRVAATGIADRHSAHSLVLLATSGSVFIRSMSRVTGFTTKK